MYSMCALILLKVLFIRSITKLLFTMKLESDLAFYSTRRLEDLEIKSKSCPSRIVVLFVDFR